MARTYTDEAKRLRDGIEKLLKDATQCQKCGRTMSPMQYVAADHECIHCKSEDVFPSDGLDQRLAELLDPTNFTKQKKEHESDVQQ